MYCLKNKEIVEHIGLSDRAFQYGDGCFTTIQVNSGHLSLWERHLKRLQDSARKLFLTLDWSFILSAQLYWQKYCQNQNGTFKILISRGCANRGYGFTNQYADVYFFMYPSHEIVQPYQEIKSTILASQIGLTMPQLVGVKSLNRLEQIILKQEAQQLTISEAFVFDIQQHLVEGISSNCFIYDGHSWKTPLLNCNGIHGVMRTEILTRMQHLGISHQKTIITKEDLMQSQAAFFCNALHPMLAVSQIQHLQLNCDITQDLFTTLNLDQIL